MSLSPFDSFQSRFVTYLLNRPRILCELYADTYSDVTDDCESEILDIESETGTRRGRK